MINVLLVVHALSANAPFVEKQVRLPFQVERAVCRQRPYKALYDLDGTKIPVMVRLVCTQ